MGDGSGPMGQRKRDLKPRSDVVGVAAAVLTVVAALAGAVAIGLSRGLRFRDLIGTGQPAARDSGLSAAIVGNTKYAVADILGPPRIATFAGVLPAQHTYMDADTWYYPLKPEDATAIAISFDGTTATKVDFFRAPRA